MIGNNESRKRPHSEDAGETGEDLSKKAAVSTSVPVAATPEAARWKKFLGMSPPQKKVPVDGAVEGGATFMTKTDASLGDVEQRMKADEWGEEYYVNEDATAAATDEQKIVHFLYGVDFCKNESSSTRVAEVQKFLKGDAKKRMMDLLKKDSDLSHRPDNIEIWRKVQGVILRYSKQTGAFTIFDGKNMPVAMRTQATKNCYQHATGGTVGYKIAFEKGDNDHTVHTVDVAKAMRRYYNDDKLKRRVLQNKGGKSQTLLEKMVKGTGLQISSVIGPNLLHVVASLLKEEGPALISRFCTDDLLKNKGQSGDYVNADGTFRVHQFDNVNGVDTHTFLQLGAALQGEKHALQTMEEKNMKPKEDAATGPVVHAVSQSFSSESHESDTEAEAVLEGAGGLHAMILIGSREDDSGKTWFLIQNTWKSLPVFEASQSYLAHHLNQRTHCGKLVFLMGKLQEHITLPLIDQGLCLESNDGNDVAEESDEEEEEDQEDTDDLEE